MWFGFSVIFFAWGSCEGLGLRDSGLACLEVSGLYFPGLGSGFRLSHLGLMGFVFKAVGIGA